MTNLILMSAVLLVALFLSFLHLISESFSKLIVKHHNAVLSFSAGTMIALLFLIILPEILHISTEPIIFLLMLLGFILFHLSEKYLYQHGKNKRERMKELKELHVAGFFIDHFILGLFFVTTVELTGSIGLVILIPIILHILSSSIAMEHIHERAKTHLNKFVLSLSPFLGALVAFTLEVDETIQVALLAFIFGMLLYIVNRDVMPKKEKGSSTLFVAGVALVLAIWWILIFVVV